MQDGGFNSLASNVIKLSVNETKWSSLLARNIAFILYSLRFEYLISGPKVTGTFEKRALGLK